MNNSADKYKPSPLYRGDDSLVDKTKRLFEFVEVDRDEIGRRVEKRARKFQGWRGNSTQLQPPKTQKYIKSGFLDFTTTGIHWWRMGTA